MHVVGEKRNKMQGVKKKKNDMHVVGEKRNQMQVVKKKKSLGLPHNWMWNSKSDTILQESTFMT